MSRDNKMLLCILSMIALLFILFHVFSKRTFEDHSAQYEKLSNEIVASNISINQLKEQLYKKYDSLKIIEKEKIIIEKQIRENQDEIINTNSIDSLIVLYYKYRTADSTFRQ